MYGSYICVTVRVAIGALFATVPRPPAVPLMTCCFSGKEVPTDKLLVLYYPPSMAHYGWDRSVYAAARAKEGLEQLVAQLRSAYWKRVVGIKPLTGVLAGAAGLAILFFWIQGAVSAWDQIGFFRRYGAAVVAMVLLAFAYFRLKALSRRMRVWDSQAKETVAVELDELETEIAAMPDDPSAEEAAAVFRRKCPDVLSEIAFDGTYFRAFTYMDFLFYPQLKHPTTKEDLPSSHSLNRDAYYVGDIVYDGWRVFHKDQREVVDPRFIGSGGRRGVI